jgi:7-carboxy-7-deazaguanine synthase
MNMSEFRVAEKFVSINGEGMRAGQLAVFIRFCGCNLRCSYCDTAWAWEFDAPDMSFEVMTAEEILAYIRGTGVLNVTLTGGEPLNRPGILDLLRLLAADEALSVEIETNGSQDLAEICKLTNRPHLTVDYKLPGSGMERHMHLPSFALLDERDVVKFVCGSAADLERACEIMRELALVERTNVYLSAVFGRIEPAEIVEFMKDKRLNGVNFQLQMHKFIWPPDMKGV